MSGTCQRKCPENNCINSGHFCCPEIVPKIDRFQRFPDTHFLSGICPEYIFGRNLPWKMTITIPPIMQLIPILIYIIDSIFACSASLLSMTKDVLNVNSVVFAFFCKINLTIFGNIIQDLSGILLSGICHVQISVIFKCPKFVQLIYPESVQNFWCLKLLDKFRTQQNSTQKICVKIMDIFWTHKTITGHFPNIFRHIPDIYFFIGLSQILFIQIYIHNFLSLDIFYLQLN